MVKTVKKVGNERVKQYESYVRVHFRIDKKGMILVEKNKQKAKLLLWFCSSKCNLSFERNFEAKSPLSTLWWTQYSHQEGNNREK